MDKVYSKKTAVIGFFFVSIIGTLSHFVYEWSQNNSIVGAFSAVNESTWEHLKMAIIPSFVWLIIVLFTQKEKKNFFIANLISFLTIMISILIVFYGYKAIIDKDIVIIDILLFYISIGLGQYVLYKVTNYKKLPKILDNISVIFLIILFASFIVFTYIPPKIEIFRNPVNNGYGIANLK